MGIGGFFKAERKEYHLGEPIWITLIILNETEHDAYLFVPQGRADGIRIAVKEGGYFQIADMSKEPEVGLVSEKRLPKGGIYSQRYLLTQWLYLKEPGDYTVECAIRIESYNVSIREHNACRVATNVDVSTDIHFTILA